VNPEPVNAYVESFENIKTRRGEKWLIIADLNALKWRKTGKSLS
jgi:hypothetical protein